jgi:tRNA-dihydrouridine synthase
MVLLVIERVELNLVLSLEQGKIDNIIVHVRNQKEDSKGIRKLEVE